MRTSYMALAAAVLVIGGTAPAFAGLTPIPDTAFSSSAGGGNFGVDGFGNQWSWNPTENGPPPVAAGSPTWGSPGLGFGTNSYGSATGATGFTVTFTGSPTIDQTPSPFLGGYNEYTRFEVIDPSTGNNIAWNETVSGNTIMFTAPTGAALQQGESYFVNVVFDTQGLDGSNTGFSAVFSTPGPVPGAGVAGLAALALAGLYMRARRA